MGLPYYLADIGGYQISDELFRVVVDGPAFLYCSDNRREIIISQNHLCTIRQTSTTTK